MVVENLKFKNERGIELAGRIYSKEENYTSGVIFSHGLFSSKDGYKITRMAAAIVNCGYALMTFDFTFSGESQGNISDISVAEEVNDLKAAVNFFKSKGITKIHLMGSSMGAAVTILTASLGLFEIETLILIATPLKFSELIPEIKKSDYESLDPEGYTSLSGIMVKNRFIKELFKIDMIDAVKKIKSPSLLVHGKLDKVVSFSNHKIFRENCVPECVSLVIEDGDHNLTREQDIDVISAEVERWLGKFNV